MSSSPVIALLGTANFRFSTAVSPAMMPSDLMLLMAYTCRMLNVVVANQPLQ